MKKYIIFSLISLFFCCVNINEKQKIQQNNSVVDLLPTISKFTMTKTVNGRKLYVIKADKAVVDEKNKVVTVYNGDAEIYDKKIQVANVKFEVAKCDVSLGDVYFFGKNVISTVENEKIITYDIKYNSKENKIFSDKEIKIYKNGNVIEGVGFETFDGFQTIRIYKNVVTTQ